ncbi:MAG: hypothetical protein IVW36_04455 [Dehalococcoidia bacterium]|nr:hypothetical protein [Dehalococcoidia bacterium]
MSSATPELTRATRPAPIAAARRAVRHAFMHLATGEPNAVAFVRAVSQRKAHDAQPVPGATAEDGGRS